MSIKAKDGKLSQSHHAVNLYRTNFSLNFASPLYQGSFPSSKHDFLLTSSLNKS